MKLNPKDGSTGIKATQQQLEAHLWGAANVLRGKTAGQDYKNYYILSLMFFKRLCDQWEHEADGVTSFPYQKKSARSSPWPCGISSANDELRGVFTVDWAQPAPDGSGKKLIPNEVVHALIVSVRQIHSCQGL